MRYTSREIKKLREKASKYPWDDLRFSLAGERIDSASTRYSYDVFNGGVQFDDNARYPDEPISMIAQMPHEWLEEDAVRPHVHYIQTSSTDVNWLLAYKYYKNGKSCTKDSNVTLYSNHTLVAGSPIFDYSSGTIVQIATFGNIDMKGMLASSMLHCVLFRDSANASSLFSGADTAAGDHTSLEFDIHYRKRSGDDKIYLGTYHEFSHLKPEYQKLYNIDNK